MVDLGHEITAAHRPALDRADHILVCLPLERVALSAAKRILHQLKNNLKSAATLHPVIVDVGGQMNLPLKAIETYLEYPLQAVIAISPGELAQSVNKGEILVNAYAQSQTTQQFRQLAGQYIRTKEKRP